MRNIINGGGIMNSIVNIADFKIDDLVFAWDFDGATLGGVQRLGPDWYFFKLREDTQFWFYFKIKGCKNRQLILETKDNMASFEHKATRLGTQNFARRPFLSYNNWDFVPFDYAEQDSHEDKRFRYIQTFSEDEVYICFGIPYTPFRMEKYIDGLLQHPHANRLQLGCTRIGLPINALIITDPNVSNQHKKGIIIIGREDQEETSAQFAYEGFINTLLSDEYSQLRKKTIFWTVPVVSLDGQKTGAHFSAGFGYASNRWQGDKFIPTYLKHIKKGINEWIESGIDLVMAGKFHSPGIWDTVNHGYSWLCGVKSYRNAGRSKPSYCMAERYDVIEAICKYLKNGAMEISNLEVRPVGRFERFIRDIYKMDSVWCIEIMADNIEQARNEGALVFKGIAQWLNRNK